MKNLSALVRGCSAAVLLAACGSAFAVDHAADTAGLLGRYPGLHMLDSQGRPQIFFGVPMTTADDPRAAADQWLHDHASGFAAGDLNLRYEWEAEIDSGRFTTFTYSQVIDGLPVENSRVKILVLNAPDGQKVVSAAAKVTPLPDGGFAPATLTAQAALAVVQARDEFKAMPLWSQPELVVFYGEGDFPHFITPVRAWKFVGESPNAGDSRKFTFFVDAATGALLHARNEILSIDVTGTVQAMATPSPDGNAAADHSGNPPALRGVPNVRVRINGNNVTSAYTDVNGNFTIPWSGTTAVTLDTGVTLGRWATIVDNNGTALGTATVSATPGTPATLLLNPVTSEFTNAQVNALIHQTTTHNFFRDRAPTFSALDSQLPANTGVSGTCNAFYNGSSTNFYNLGGGCNNTAFSSVVSHEYGHHIVNRLGLAQGGFGEGFGDCMSILQYDDFVVGRYFSTGGGAVRTPDTTNRQYPCTAGEVHACGEVIGGVICEIRRNFGTKYGSSPGLVRARQLFVDWAQHTLGGGSDGMQSAEPRTLVEFLTINDDDGNLNNGTPDMCELADAFRQHSITTSAVNTSPLNFTVPGGFITTGTPDTPTVIRFSVAPGCYTPTLNTGRLLYRTSSATGFTSLIMTQTAPNAYQASIPPQPCPTVVQYYFQVGSNRGNVTYPEGGATSAVNLYVPASTDIVNDTFETATGWTVGPTTATTGAWVRGDPVGTGAQPEDDHTVSGVNCWFTGQGAVGGALGDADVDGGYTTLVSPTFNLSGYADAEISYYRWYSNGAGATPYTDTFRVEFSTDNGANWRAAETVGPGSASDANVNGGWIFASWRLGALNATPSSQFRVRFIAEDADPGSLVEAAVDDFAIKGFNCGGTGPDCPADFNQDGGVDGGDVEAFFLTWQTGSSAADVNQDGGVDGADVTAFFTAWSTGGC